MNKDWLDISMLEDYLDGKLDSRDMHFVERAVLEDPFAAEALEGLRNSPRRVATLSLLQKQLQERTLQNEVKKRVWGITWQRLSIAATAAVLFVSAGIMFWMKEDNRQRQLAMQPKKVDVTIDTASTAATAGSIRKPSVEDSMVQVAIDEAKSNALAKTIKKSAQVPARPAEIAPATFSRASGISATRDTLPMVESRQRAAMAAATVPASAEAARQGRSIAGKVVAEGGQPVAGATVRIPRTDKVATTDINGYFEIPAVKEEKITAASIGYAIANMVATPKKPVRITLKTQSSALDEVVVVTGNTFGRQQNLGNTGILPDSTRAKAKVAGMEVSPLPARAEATSRPQMELSLYNRYLSENNRLKSQKSTGKMISVGFDVDSKGNPENFRVLLGDDEQDKEQIAELIRLVKAGPRWTHGTGAAAHGKVSFVF